VGGKHVSNRSGRLLGPDAPTSSTRGYRMRSKAEQSIAATLDLYRGDDEARADLGKRVCMSPSYHTIDICVDEG
jgi:hypothetical protein